MYAVIQTGGKQYQVAQGDILYIEKIDAPDDSTISFQHVIAVADDNGIRVGTPLVEGATVSAKVLKTGKAKKISVFTYKSKKGEKRKMGHRQPYTRVEIVSIDRRGQRLTGRGYDSSGFSKVG